MSGNYLVGQSGGPTSVINASLAGVVETAARSKRVRRVLGMRYGIEGVLNDQLVDFSSESEGTIRGLRAMPGSALGSSRLKLKDEHFPAILDRLKQHNIRYLSMIGGNDTMDTIHRVTDYAATQGYELYGVGVPKTVDNDLFGTDHTPGYPSAARYVALSVLQAGVLASDMQKVDQFVVFQSIGRSAGWLPAAAALARQPGRTAPHLILLPERAFDRERFLDAVEAAHRQYGFVSVVCGEGLCNADGTAVSASTTTDKFNNVEFGAMGGASVAMVLHRIITQRFGWRGEFQVTESLPMCAADRAGKRDVREAFECGRRAAKLALRGTSGVMVTINRLGRSTKTYEIEFGEIALAEVAVHARPMPDDMIATNGMDVTKAFMDYARPLVGDLPAYPPLKGKLAKAPKAERKAAST